MATRACTEPCAILFASYQKVQLWDNETEESAPLRYNSSTSSFYQWGHRRHERLRWQSWVGLEGHLVLQFTPATEEETEAQVRERLNSRLPSWSGTKLRLGLRDLDSIHCPSSLCQAHKVSCAHLFYLKLTFQPCTLSWMWCGWGISS